MTGYIYEATIRWDEANTIGDDEMVLIAVGLDRHDVETHSERTDDDIFYYASTEEWAELTSCSYLDDQKTTADGWGVIDHVIDSVVKRDLNRFECEEIARDIVTPHMCNLISDSLLVSAHSYEDYEKALDRYVETSIKPYPIATELRWLRLDETDYQHVGECIIDMLMESIEHKKTS